MIRFIIIGVLLIEYFKLRKKYKLLETTSHNMTLALMEHDESFRKYMEAKCK